MARFAFYYHPLSSYCWKVSIALAELGIEHERHVVNIGDPAVRAQFAAKWPTAKIPLLVDQERDCVVPETSIQIEYLDRYSANGQRMLPNANPASGSALDPALQARLWDRMMDCYLMTPMSNIVADRMRPESQRDALGLTKARDQLAATYRVMDGRLAESAWLGGEDFSIADCSAMPALWYANTLLPVATDTPQLLAYFQRLLQRASVQAALDEARPWFKYFPYAELIPAEFL